MRDVVGATLKMVPGEATGSGRRRPVLLLAARLGGGARTTWRSARELVIVEQEAVVSMEVVGDDLVVVCLEGDVDLTAASAIQARVREGLQLRCHVVIDLTRATFMDSAAMHVLFQAHAAA